MITVNLCGNAEKYITDAANERGITVDRLVSDIINKYLVPLHTIDKEGMAEGYADMGDINVKISEGNAD